MPSFLQRLVGRFRSKKIRVPVVRLTGVIGAGSMLRPGLTLASASGPLAKAFAVKRAPAVAILINSPGGSPVQSRLIFQRIRDLAEEKGKRVLVYVEDVAASGGYMIACAGDEIIVDPSSIVGSIGVVSAGFGFTEAIARLGIERRVYTAGTRKAVLDPFRPEEPEDIEHLKSLQREVHRTFVDLVRSRRGADLSQSEDLFSGLFWSGETGVQFGLADRLGDLHGDLRRRFGKDVEPKPISSERGFLRRRLGATTLGATALGALSSASPGALFSAGDILATVEERSLWARFGL